MTDIHSADPTVKVARDLREIESLTEHLMVQAIHKANDHLMPGGEAMVAIAPVGSPDEWSENVAAAEYRHLATCTKLDHSRCVFDDYAHEDENTAPPLQALLYWSERWRAVAGYALDRRPTIATEVNFIRHNLQWAAENEPHWAAFTSEVARARTRLENLLIAGNRAERGAPCLYETCNGARLVRKLVPTRGEDGQKTWTHSDWHCPRCKRSWDNDRYAAMVTAAHEATKFEDIGGETWCTVDYAARQVDRSEATIRQWLHKGHLSAVCIVAGRRTRFVRLADVLDKHKISGRRKLREDVA